VSSVKTAQAEHGHWFRFALRWKLLTAFAGTFTLIFIGIAVWILLFSATNAQNRLVAELTTTALGGASTINAEAFAELVSTVPAVQDPATSTGFGYPTSALYRNSSQEMLDIYSIVNGASPYTYFKDPADGQLYFASSYGYLVTPQFGVQFKVPVAQIVDSPTYDLMDQGLNELTQQPAYTDAFGKWISVYAPITLEDGVVVGGIGVDYSLAYVDEVRTNVQRQIFPVLIGVYLLLLVLVLFISILIVRPLKRLTKATRRIADGEYDLNIRKIIRTRLPDEMFDLAESFGEMAEKIAARERKLTQEVRRLTVEIDQSKRDESVREITENEAFADLAQRAKDMRDRLRKEMGKTNE
jgi:methyl-accepting chemotaxis protein